ncbi:MAG: hypothetical protein CMF74_17135 [Maricaulis sp.]|nr:hypothetical protein [Maricaulis sp.]
MSIPDPRLSEAQTRLRMGRPEDAEALADALIRDNPDDTEALYLKGMCRRAVHDFAGALQIFEGLDARKPGQAGVLVFIGLSHQGLGRNAEAEAAFAKAEGANPNEPLAAFYRGMALFDLGDKEAAVMAFGRCLELEPRHVPALRSLAHTLFSMRRLAEAERIGDRGLKMAPGDPVLAAVKSDADLRRGDADAAVQRLESLPASNASPVNAAMALKVLGDARDALGDHKGAFDAWAEANRREREWAEPAYGLDESAYSLAGVRRAKFHFEKQAGLETGAADGPAPVFLVGFPRSGTTLLENILAAHPNVTASEEKAHAWAILAETGEYQARLPELMQADEAKLGALREAYWARACPDGKPGPGHVFIDKLPANLAWIGVLAKVFPGAKFLIAVRDPRDCVLSAFQQRFAMGAAMYRMLDLEDAAAWYDASFGAAEAARKAMPGLVAHVVRYEKLVEDLEGEARAAIAFLGLDWDDDVLDYRAKAASRTINTPSGPQVDKPVYSDAVARWKPYAFAMNDVRDFLDPWVEYWGYGD